MLVRRGMKELKLPATQAGEKGQPASDQLGCGGGSARHRTSPPAGSAATACKRKFHMARSIDRPTRKHLDQHAAYHQPSRHRRHQNTTVLPVTESPDLRQPDHQRRHQKPGDEAMVRAAVSGFRGRPGLTLADKDSQKFVVFGVPSGQPGFLAAHGRGVRCATWCSLLGFVAGFPEAGLKQARWSAHLADGSEIRPSGSNAVR